VRRYGTLIFCLLAQAGKSVAKTSLYTVGHRSFLIFGAHGTEEGIDVAAPFSPARDSLLHFLLLVCCGSLFPSVFASSLGLSEKGMAKGRTAFGLSSFGTIAAPACALLQLEAGVAAGVKLELRRT